MKLIIKVIILIFVSLIFILGCKKTNKENSNPTQQDNILFTDISPDTSVTSIAYLMPYYPYLPEPPDSFASISFDLDHDNINDISFGVSTFYYFVSASNPMANYNFSSGISLINNNDLIAYKDSSGPCPIAQPFLKDSIISISSKYIQGASIYSHGFYIPCYIDGFSEDTYYGIKLSRPGGYIFGWVLINFNNEANKLTLKEFAINKTINKPIKAGQKQ